MLPYRDEKGVRIFPTGRFIGVYFSEELKYAKSIGSTVTPLRGYLFKKGEDREASCRCPPKAKHRLYSPTRFPPTEGEIIEISSSPEREPEKRTPTDQVLVVGV